MSLNKKNQKYDKTSYDVQVILDEMNEFTPETGFNLVGIDSYEMPGEKLYLIAHFDTLKEAEKAQTKYDKSKTMIYHK